MDRNLRDLERVYRLTGTVEDESAYLRGLLRSNYLTEAQLRIAAQLKYPPAQFIFSDLSSPLVGNMGVPFYGELEDFLFKLVVADPEEPTPQLPFLLTLAYLKEVQWIFELNPEEDMQLLAQHAANIYVDPPHGLTFETLAEMSRDIFEIWIETRWDEEMQLQNQSIYDAIVEAEPIWDLAANANFDREDASFHNASSAYWHFSRAIRSAQGQTSLNPRTFTDLRLSIGDVINALAEQNQYTVLLAQENVLNNVRDKIIPLILDLD